MSVEIEKGIALPVNSHYVSMYPIQELEPGESFLAPLEKRGSIASQCSRITSVDGRHFTVRKVSNTEVRCWRIK